MADIIIAFTKIEEAKALKKLLIRSGYEVSFACDRGADVLSRVNKLDEGIVICGHRLGDYSVEQLRDAMPRGFQMLVVASPAKLELMDTAGLVTVSMPLRVKDLTDTLDTLLASFSRRNRRRRRPKPRTDEEKREIEKAKALLMDRNHMSEEEAHRYIQKTSMNNGTNMTETAQMILDLSR